MSLRALFFCIMLSNCAYHLGHQERRLPGGYKTVFVSQFSNATQAVGAEAFFTNAMIRELQRSGFAFVSQREQAEVIVTGRLLMLDHIGNSPTPVLPNFDGSTFNSALFTRYLLNAVALVVVQKAADNSVIWQTTIRGSKNFLAPSITKPGARTSNPLYNQSIKDENVRLVANDMMNEAFDQLTENF